MPRSVPALYVPPARLILVSDQLRGVEKNAVLFHEDGHAIGPSDASHSDVHALSLLLMHPPQQVVALMIQGVIEPTAQDLWDGLTPRWAAMLRAKYIALHRRVA